VVRDKAPPLVVDLDGTLLATDMLWESVLLLVREDPACLFWLPVWLMQGKAYLKRQIAQRVVPEAVLLPCRPEVQQLIHEAQEEGRQVILATATDELVAEEIAACYGFFTDVIASDGQVNRRGKAKLKALREHLGPDQPFDYVGDDGADLPLWEAARYSHLVQPAWHVGWRARHGDGTAVKRVLKRGWFERFKALLRAIRVHQWPKNALLFVPLLLAHQASQIALFAQTALACLAFSLCASSVYVTNDLLDLEDDRQHPRKKHRPFAAGTLQIKTGVLLAPLLAVTSFALAFWALPLLFTGILALYFIATTAYSIFLKRLLLVDVLTLAGLYTLRVAAGGVAVGVWLSPWLVSFSMFFFLSLAFVKRYAGLRVLEKEGRTGGHRRRDYRVEDMALLRVFGPASGFLAVFVLSFYISSGEVTRLYERPALLWLVGPPLLYWIGRIWFKAHRGEMHDDPVIFSLRDPASYIVGALVVGVMFLANLP
jgi:4-hydroxybenzoate polyprenyltransferase/phosphoserine phosphatase